jgi:hypothetical protein
MAVKNKCWDEIFDEVDKVYSELQGIPTLFKTALDIMLVNRKEGDKKCLKN